MNDNKQRFSDRVEDYIKYRPHYPDEVVSVLEKEIGLDHRMTIADIGSGTGISSLPFLKRNYTVIGVEPNREMREASEQTLSGYIQFTAVDGSAEASKLPDKSVDVILCGQAFHWFDQTKCKVEFDRILKDGGHQVFIWNARSTKSRFQKEYEKALNDHIPEYKFVNHRNIDDSEIARFFLPKTSNKICLANKQVLSLQGLKGRLMSSSYCPKSGEQHDRLMLAMERLFDKYQANGTIEFEYETQMYWC